MAFANAPVAAVHALAYPLGGHHHLAHGLSNSLVLVPVLEFNLVAATPLYAQLGRAILPETQQLPDAQVARAFIDAVRALVASMPYAQTLRAAGVAETDLPLLAEDAMQVQRLLINNPCAVSYDDALAIYQAAF